MSVRRYVVFLSALFLLSLLLSPWGALSFDLLFFGLLTAFLRVWEATPAWRTREAFAQASREVVL